MAIAKLTEADVFVKNPSFNPNAPLTRVQASKVLTIAFHLKGDGHLPSFQDLRYPFWAISYIDAVTDNKIMVGHTNGLFGFMKLQIGHSLLLSS
jgi:hypothetical protein